MIYFDCLTLLLTAAYWMFGVVNIFSSGFVIKTYYINLITLDSRCII